MGSFFVELSVVMILAFVVSYIMRKLKQPLLVGYIITGILASPLFFDFLSTTENYETFSHLGIALLLFIVGLHLNLKLIKEVGFVAFVVGLVQIILTALIGYFLINSFWIDDASASFLMAMGLALSSTIVIVKILSDQKQLEKVHGKITLGILIVQDLVAIAFLMILNSMPEAFAVGLNANQSLEMIKLFLIGTVALFAVLGFSKLVIERIMDKIASSQELLYLFVIAWCFGIAGLFHILGFSVEIGAIVAGVALASSPFQHEISSKVKPLRDFFIIMFFILLGSQMIPVVDSYEAVKVFNTDSGITDIPFALVENFTSGFAYIAANSSTILIPALLLSLFVVIAKPLIILITMNLFGFQSRVAFQTGVNLGQISEFSLIMLLVAKDKGLITSGIVSSITLIIMFTIIISTFLMSNSSKIHSKLRWFLKLFEFREPQRGIEEQIKRRQEFILFGYNRVSAGIVKSLDQMGKKYIIVEYNPEVIRALEEKGVPCIYGDASDPDLINDFDLESTHTVISSISDSPTNTFIMKEVKKRNKAARVILTSDDPSGGLDLYDKGADYVMVPHHLGGTYVSELLNRNKNTFDNLFKHKIDHINDLKRDAEVENVKRRRKKDKKKK